MSPDPVKFWARVERDNPKSCWPWARGKNSKGYGSFMENRHHYCSHRAAFFIANGWWPEVVMHTCDNPACCNPAHLVGGDHAANMADKAAKGRAWHGEKHPHATLSNVEVREIAALRGVVSQRKLAKRYNTTSSTVSKIHTGRQWDKITGLTPAKCKAQRGSDHHAARLTESAVREIRTKKMSQTQYAAKFGVSRSCVADAQRGSRWSHVT